MIKKILIANRGEIAVRIIRSCREMGIRSVAVFSEADRTSLHVRCADEAYLIGPPQSSESYLNIDKIIETAKKSKADAIHPGYGFLSENTEFSDRCKKESIIFIGPSSYSISAMGDKITSRINMTKAGIRVVPGITENISIENNSYNTENINNSPKIQRIIKEIGLPIIIKASAGGGGKGMRLVRNIHELPEALRVAKAEALSSFNNDSVYIERYIESPHHIEFQILADRYGNVIHLCERECSVQRRHQKIIEETPSPLMIPELRKEMGEQAIAAAKAVNYEGAGTIEFLVDDDRNYYFLEMNTRLQVEHPITEVVVGVDLVKEQIKIADGQKLTIKQENVIQRGHAIECRIYAEDPDNNFMPSIGIVKHIREPHGLGVRCDGYVYEGYEIPIYYDPMISKLIVWESKREDAIKRMQRALHEYKITGIKNNIKFLNRVLQTNDFISGKYNTHLIENNKEFLHQDENYNESFDHAAIISAYLEYIDNLNHVKDPSDLNSSSHNDKWKFFGRSKSIQRL